MTVTRGRPELWLRRLAQQGRRSPAFAGRTRVMLEVEWAREGSVVLNSLLFILNACWTAIEFRASLQSSGHHHGRAGGDVLHLLGSGTYRRAGCRNEGRWNLRRISSRRDHARGADLCHSWLRGAADRSEEHTSELQSLR